MQLRGVLSQENLLQYVDNFRIEMSLNGEAKTRRKSMGQFFTPIEVAQQMLQPIDSLPEKVRVLDPGAGAGILSAAVFTHILSSNHKSTREIEFVAYEVDVNVSPYLRKTLDMCASLCARQGINFKYTMHIVDFVEASTTCLYSSEKFDLAILNPPYGKIRSGGNKWRLLRKYGLPRSNLYATFMTLASILLKDGGRLVSITPRSFCNGPYFLPFRKAFLSQMSLSHVHVYKSRNKAFGDDGVLQENIILCAKKSKERNDVNVTSSDSPLDKDISVQVLKHHELVNSQDRNLVIHLVRNGNEREISRFVNTLTCSLHDLEISVSTGRVVDFRARHLLRKPHEAGSVPLLLPSNLINGYVKWPLARSSKLSAIDYEGSKNKLLVPTDNYVLVKRFSSKEQKRRLTAAILEPSHIESAYVGIENHVNYFHKNGAGLAPDLAKGLAVYLNSSVVDQYFRLFSGHTQVNATDLGNLKYPDASSIEEMGARIGSVFPDQQQLDQIMAEVLGMQEPAATSTQAKIDESLDILRTIGVPREQQNDRSALTLLALVDVKPEDEWSVASAPLRAITEMKEYFSTHYGTTYAPNTRETVRRQTIHQFWQMGLVAHNPDKPDRPTNSPYYCYQISEPFLRLVRAYASPAWNKELTHFRIEMSDNLTTLHGRKRLIQKIPVIFPDGSIVSITSGGQNALIKRVVEEFCPRFAKGGEVLYLGDAGDQLRDDQIRKFKQMGILLDKHGKMPDVIVYLESKDWLIVIEAVTSHGPIDRKRQNELKQLFSSSSAGLVYVTAFETRRAMTKHLRHISRGTEVWIAESPDHLIHFDGERFLGPYS
ncbi:MAG: BsuBI/PstI family type II restriction endonuclease [Chloroflexi bacterium]|nr:BsuBI/PstI family type II restriction endonuclease [Chloroflexota bacterium]